MSFVITSRDDAGPMVYRVPEGLEGNKIVGEVVELVFIDIGGV